MLNSSLLKNPEKVSITYGLKVIYIAGDVVENNSYTNGAPCRDLLPSSVIGPDLARDNRRTFQLHRPHCQTSL